MINRKEFLMFALAMGGGCLLPTIAYGDTGGRKAADSFGRSISLDSSPRYVRPTGKFSQSVLYSISPDLADPAGISRLSPNAEPDESACSILLQPEGATGAATSAAVLEELAESDCPVLDVGSSAKSSPEALEDIERAIGQEAMFFDGTFEQLGNTYRSLGRLLGKPSCEQLADYVDNVVQIIKDKRGALSGKPKTLFLATGHTGVLYEPFNYLQQNIFDYLNCECINNSLKPLAPDTEVDVIDIANLVEHNPDVILFRDTTKEYFEMNGGPAQLLWSNVPAITENRALYIPCTEFSWLGYPLVSQCLGILWLGKTLYPALFEDVDIDVFASRFYQLFVHADIPQGLLQTVLNNTSVEMEPASTETEDAE